MDLKNLTPQELLTLHTKVMEELVSQNVIQNRNSPAGDVGEEIAGFVLNLERKGGMQEGYDLEGGKSKATYEVKARRVNTKLHFSGFIPLKFDYLVMMVMDPEYRMTELFVVSSAEADKRTKPKGTKGIQTGERRWTFSSVEKMGEELAGVAVRHIVKTVSIEDVRTVGGG